MARRFFGATQHDVKTIVRAEHDVAICDDCVGTCVEIVRTQRWRRWLKTPEKFAKSPIDRQCREAERKDDAQG
jgi:ATP-dependent protease Clp ATPase subunit